jgi:hypothetical protein
MNTDLRELFETGLGPEPVLPPAHSRVAAGRQALRRRRIATSSVGAAVIAVVALGAVQLGPNAPTSAPSPTPANTVTPDTPDTRSEEEVRLTTAVPVDDAWLDHCGRGGQPTCTAYTDGAAPVAIQADGSVTRTTEDVVIMRRADDWVTPDGTHAVAVELRTATYPQPCWYVLTRSPSGKVTARTADPAGSSIDFDTWAAALRNGTDEPGAPTLLRDRMLVDD